MSFAARTLLTYALGAAVAVLAPLFLAPLDLRFVGDSYGPAHRPYELFGLTASVLILGFLARSVRLRAALPPHRAFASLVPVLLPAFIGLIALQQIVEFSTRAWDLACYEAAAKAVIAGQSPYGGCYYYPPLFAVALGLLERALAGLLGPFGWTPETTWTATLYVWQAGQVFLLQACVVLCQRLALRCGLGPFVAAAVVGALFVLDNPIVRTLRHGQVNFAILALLLFAIDRVERRPAVAGAAVALAAQIKIHPGVLIGAWLMGHRYRAALFAGVSLLAIGVALLAVPDGAERIGEFFAYARSFPTSSFFRDNSLYSVAKGTLRVVGLAPERAEPLARAFGGLLSLVVVAWLAWRALLRDGRVGGDRQGAQRAPEEWRVLGHSMDALAFTLLCAPLVWEHHYVLAIPIAIHAISARGAARPAWVGFACLLVFAVPTFDVYPLSYQRLAGLLMLLHATAPPLPEPPPPDPTAPAPESR